ncbi:Required for respiratory growth protein 7, mitochondrial [Frankliniella fusca]|uniref:Required for respiratory growth protein 7, mitochondrial n=1 Tax=Frankliniella fusca TaxID=407009 RepID=A0AAE1HYR7_9NEOP|nr:Required for respiratory growth protein 7, mitochondrial [Frankliniella fusca]
MKRGQSDPIVLSLLASLCCKRGRGNCKSANKEICSPTSARSAFLLHITTPNDLTRQVHNYMATLYKEKRLFQPIIILVGPSLSEISASYVQIQDVRYYVRTPLAAVDVCFKSFFALDLQYPSLAYPIWLFIQKFFYNIVTEADSNVPRVVSVLSSLKSAMSRQAV